MENMVTDIHMKLNYDRMHIDEVLEIQNLSTTTTTKTRTRTIFVAFEDHFQVKKSLICAVKQRCKVVYNLYYMRLLPVIVLL